MPKILVTREGQIMSIDETALNHILDLETDNDHLRSEVLVLTEDLRVAIAQIAALMKGQKVDYLG